MKHYVRVIIPIILAGTISRKIKNMHLSNALLIMLKCIINDVENKLTISTRITLYLRKEKY